MARQFDAANPEHFTLMALSDAELRGRGIQPDEIAALREAQWSAPPARSADEVARLREDQRKSASREKKAE